MGLDIWMHKRDDWRAQHPDWPSGRYAGDREFHTHFAGTLQDWTEPGFPYETDVILYRPADFAAFRERARTSVNPERWLLAADLLEADTDYWLYFSW